MNSNLEHALANQSCQPETAIPTAPGELHQDPREIRIFKVLNGFVVFCGCKQVVFDNLGKMIAELERYYLHPEQVEKEYLKIK